MATAAPTETSSPGIQIAARPVRRLSCSGESAARGGGSVGVIGGLLACGALLPRGVPRRVRARPGRGGRPTRWRSGAVRQSQIRWQGFVAGASGVQRRDIAQGLGRELVEQLRDTGAVRGADVVGSAALIARVRSACDPSAVTPIPAQVSRSNTGDRFRPEFDQLDRYVLLRIARRIRSAVGNGTSAGYLEHGRCRPAPSLRSRRFSSLNLTNVENCC